MLRRHFSAAVFAAALVSCSSDTASTIPPQGPDTFRVRFETTKGNFTVDVVRAWSPIGADRFHELVKSGFYDGARFFRVVPGFVVQFGLKGDPSVDDKWEKSQIPDDPHAMSNLPATITFATSGPSTRTSQVFINLADNSRLDPQGFTPFGRVTEGMQVVFSLHSGYGEQPNQGRIRSEGNAYLQRDFPNLDSITKATILP